MAKPRVFTRSINNGTMRQMKYIQAAPVSYLTQDSDDKTEVPFSYSINLYPQNPEHEIGGKYAIPLGYKSTVAGEPENETTPSGYFVQHIGHTKLMCDYVPDKGSKKPRVRWQDFRVQEIRTMKHGSEFVKCNETTHKLKSIMFPSERLGISMNDYSDVLSSVTFISNPDYTDNNPDFDKTLINYKLCGALYRNDVTSTTGYNFLFNKFAQQYNPHPNGIYDTFYPISDLAESFDVLSYSQITYEQVINAYKAVQGVWGEALRICIEELMENNEMYMYRGCYRKEKGGELQNVVIQPAILLTFREDAVGLDCNVSNTEVWPWCPDKPTDKDVTDYVGFNPYRFPYHLVEDIKKKVHNSQRQSSIINRFTADYLMKFAAHEMIHAFFGLEFSPQHGTEFATYWGELLTYTSIRVEELMKYVEANHIPEQIHFIQTYLKPIDYEHIYSYSDAWVGSRFAGKSTEDIYEWCKSHNLGYVPNLDTKEISRMTDEYNFHSNREDLYRLIASALA